jgi:hypothetical protein
MYNGMASVAHSVDTHTSIARQRFAAYFFLKKLQNKCYYNGCPQ